MRGNLIVKWRGRYYIYYNQHGSQPNALGKAVLYSIPDARERPKEYSKWLDATRAHFSRVEVILERHVFTVPIKTILGKESLPSMEALGVEHMERHPTHVVPLSDGLFIEWIYVVDLDQERFIVNHCCFFNLQHVPSNWEALLPQAKAYFFDPKCPRAHDSILPEVERNAFDSPRLDSAPKQILYPEYRQLNPTLVEPLRNSHLNSQPHFFACKRLFEFFTEACNDIICTSANTALQTSEFMFREVIFALLCLASCSIDLVRFIPSTKVAGESKWPFVGISRGDGVEPEFSSYIFCGFHVPGAHPGSAPADDSYWLSGVLVTLALDLSSEARMQDAISRAVYLGRAAAKTNFSAIVLTPEYVVQIRVLDGAVQHTKRLPFVSCEPRRRGFGNETYSQDKNQELFLYDEKGSSSGWDNQWVFPETPEEEENTLNYSHKLNHGPTAGVTEHWIDAHSNQSSTFDALAHLFEAQNRQCLPPSTSGNHGRFPNEIYRKIVGFTDETTHRACLSVSRAFRAYALDCLHLGGQLEALSRPGTEPQCYHPAVGFLGPFKLTERRIPEEDYETTEPVAWYPVIGNADNTASYLPHVSVAFEELYKRESRLHSQGEYMDGETQGYSLGERWHMSYGKQVDVAEGSKQGEIHPDKEPWFEVFEATMNDGNKVWQSEDLAVLYAAALFHHLRIMGFGTGKRPRFEVSQSLDADGIWDRVHSTWRRLGKRIILPGTDDRHVDRPYAIAVIKQASEDTSEGWTRAEQRAKLAAADVFLQGKYQLWLCKWDDRDRSNEFAVLVIIGSKLKLFHMDLLAPLNIPPADATSVNQEDLRRCKYIFYRGYEMALWKQVGVDIHKLSEKIGWKPATEMEVDVDGNVLPLDVMQVGDRERIVSAMQSIADIADSIAPRDLERW